MDCGLGFYLCEEGQLVFELKHAMADHSIALHLRGYKIKNLIFNGQMPLLRPILPIIHFNFQLFLKLFFSSFIDKHVLRRIIFQILRFFPLSLIEWVGLINGRLVRNRVFLLEIVSVIEDAENGIDYIALHL